MEIPSEKGRRDEVCIELSTVHSTAREETENPNGKNNRGFKYSSEQALDATDKMDLETVPKAVIERATKKMNQRGKKRNGEGKNDEEEEEDVDLMNLRKIRGND